MSVKDEKLATIENEVSQDTEDHVLIKGSRSVIILFTHVIIGILVGASFLFSFRDGTPLTPTRQHICICVIGYQMLMAEAILAMSPGSWLSTLSLKHRKFVHWTMQLVGGLMAIVGSFVKIVDKDVHWDTLHGQFGLAGMVFTAISLVNGLSSYYAFEWRRVIPGLLSKLTHICFGAVAFVTGSVCLIYGYHKNGFREWATTGFADALIALTAILAFIVIFNPAITFYRKFKGLRN